MINTWSRRGQSLFACRILIALLWCILICIYLIGGDHNNINLGSFKVQVNNKRYLNIPSLTWSSVWRQKTFTEDKTAGGFNTDTFRSFLDYEPLKNRKKKPSHHVIFFVYTDWADFEPIPSISLQTHTHLRRLRVYLRRQMGNRSDIDPIKTLTSIRTIHIFGKSVSLYSKCFIDNIIGHHLVA